MCVLNACVRVYVCMCCVRVGVGVGVCVVRVYACTCVLHMCVLLIVCMSDFTKAPLPVFFTRRELKHLTTDLVFFSDDDVRVWHYE